MPRFLLNLFKNCYLCLVNFFSFFLVFIVFLVRFTSHWLCQQHFDGFQKLLVKNLKKNVCWKCLKLFRCVKKQQKTLSLSGRCLWERASERRLCRRVINTSALRAQSLEYLQDTSSEQQAASCKHSYTYKELSNSDNRYQPKRTSIAKGHKKRANR